MSVRVDTILDLIDKALDGDTGPDAMRWTPMPPSESAPRTPSRSPLDYLRNQDRAIPPVPIEVIERWLDDTDDRSSDFLVPVIRPIAYNLTESADPMAPALECVRVVREKWSDCIDWWWQAKRTDTDEYVARGRRRPLPLHLSHLPQTGHGEAPRRAYNASAHASCTAGGAADATG